MPTALPTMPHLTQSTLPNLRALRVSIQTRWHQPNTIPGPLLANILRGALGLTLRKLVCPEGWFDHDCHTCPLYQDCAYGQIFSPSPPPDATQLRLQQDLPRPFVIEPPGLHPDEAPTPEGLTFRLMLFGSAIERLPYLISTLDRLGCDGMGRDRVPFDILTITSLHPAGDETLFTQGCPTVSLPQRHITTEDLINTPWPTIATNAPSGSASRQRILNRLGLSENRPEAPQADPTRPRLQIKFLTPLLLKSGSSVDANGRRTPAQEVRDRPPFGVLMRRLRDRLSTLSTFFGEPWQHPNFAAIGEQADQVELLHSQTQWLFRDRRSTRTGHHHEISGLIGTATYQFPDEKTYTQLSPLLKIAELLHLGKNAPWGNGAIRITKLQ